jgi:hypothetical protein
MTRTTTIAALVLILLIGSTATAQPEPQRHQGNKLIEWGWDEPDTKFMRANINGMEQFPFDGLVFHATSNEGVHLSWEVWYFGFMVALGKPDEVRRDRTP